MFMSRQKPEGGFYADGGGVDPVSGNEVPVGSLKEEVRDDVSAKLSPGEFVLPADVVRYIGLERLMKLRDSAKAGLARMEKIGQMGNAEEVENSNQLFSGEEEEEDTAEFEKEIDSILMEEEGGEEEEKKFAPGGFLTGEDLTRAPKNPMVDVRYFKNSKDGRVMFITYINQRPTIPIPTDFVPYDPATDSKLKEDEKKAEETKTTVSEEGARGRSDGELSQSQKDFLENETKEERDARMGKINDLLGKVTGLLPGASIMNVAKALGLTSDKVTQKAPVEDKSTYSEEAQQEKAAQEAKDEVSYGKSSWGKTGDVEQDIGGLSGTLGGRTVEQGGYSVRDTGETDGIDTGERDSGFDPFGNMLAKGGMVARRKYPAKKQKGKGIAASKR